MVHGHAPQRLLLHEDGHVGHAGAHALRQVGGRASRGTIRVRRSRTAWAMGSGEVATGKRIRLRPSVQ